MEKFKRKKVDKQDRAATLTTAQLKQQTDSKFLEIYNYLDKIAEKINNLEGGA